MTPLLGLVRARGVLRAFAEFAGLLTDRFGHGPGRVLLGAGLLFGARLLLRARLFAGSALLILSGCALLPARLLFLTLLFLALLFLALLFLSLL